MTNASCEVLTKTHSFNMSSCCKPPTLLPKSKDSAMDELVSSIHELKLKMVKIEEKSQVLGESSKQLQGPKIEQLRGRLPPWCM